MSGSRFSLTRCSVRLVSFESLDPSLIVYSLLLPALDTGDAHDLAICDLRGERLQEFYRIRAELLIYALELPMLTDNVGLEAWESVAPVNPHLVALHVIYNGVLILLYNIVVVLHDQGKVIQSVPVEKARKKVLEGSQGLVNVASNFKRDRAIPSFRVNVILFVSTTSGVVVRHV